LASLVPLPFAQRLLEMVKKYCVGRIPFDYVTSSDISWLRKNGPPVIKDFLDKGIKKGIHNKNMKLSYSLLIDSKKPDTGLYPLGLIDLLDEYKDLIGKPTSDN